MPSDDVSYIAYTVPGYIFQSGMNRISSNTAVVVSLLSL